MKRPYRYSAVACLLWAAMPAAGGEPVRAPRAEPEPPVCIEVEVDGQRVPAYDCLSAKLAEPAAGRRAPPPDARLGSERIAAQPGTRLSLFNQAATSQRMGNAFGESVRPQRPPPPVFVSPVIKKP